MQPQTSGRPKPAVTTAQINDYHNDLISFTNEAFKPGVDTFVIKGQPSLTKAGAEKVCKWFGALPEFSVLDSEADPTRVNRFISKYKKQEISQGFYRFIIKCRLVRGDGHFFGEGIGSCSSIESKYISRPNDAENTVLKMAKKRAFVDAVLTAFGLSAVMKEISEALISKTVAMERLQDEVIKYTEDPFK